MQENKFFLNVSCQRLDNFKISFKIELKTTKYINYEKTE